MSEEKKYYVYVHRYASGTKQGDVFYVGKGQAKRFIEQRSRSQWWERIVDKYGFTSEILMSFNNENCAFSFEMAIISFYGRDNLCNLTDGGEGPKSFIPAWRVKVYSSLGEEFDSMYHASLFLKSNGYPKATNSAISIVCDKEDRFAYGRSWSRIKIPTHDNVRTQKEVAADNLRNSLSKSVSSPVYGSFNSIMDAVRYLKKNGYPKCVSGNISSVCKGERKIAYGSKWKYT